MRTIFAALLLLVIAAHAQDVVDVECRQDSIKVKIQKEVVLSAGYEMSDIHLNDNTCVFNEENDDFFMRVLNPLTACDTYFTVNETHVQFRNTITTLETGSTYPLGVIVGKQKSEQSLSAFVSCTYRIDLRVSTLFYPNITVIPIIVPDFYGYGEFKVAMSLYTDATYRTPYIEPPSLSSDDVLFVGVNIVDEASVLTFLLIEKCWGTVMEDPESTPSYPLINDACPIPNQGNNEIQITQNGISHQAMWRGPVFQFIGKDEDYTNVWLHCDLQICINQECEPTCSARRRRRSVDGSSGYYGPGNFVGGPNIISIGPLKKFMQDKNDSVNLLILEQPHPNVYFAEGLQTGKMTPDNTMTVAIVIGVLGALALVSIILALFLLLIKMRNRPSNTGYDLSGADNKSYAT